MEKWAFLNDTFVPLDQAVLPIEDRGTQFGDGVYEVARIYQGRIFGWEEHVARMVEGSRILEISHDWTADSLQPVFSELVERNQQTDGIIYWQLTRGTAPRNHVFPKAVQANFMAYTRDYPDLSEQFARGIKVAVEPDRRWLMCHVKSVNLLANVLAKEAAFRKGAREALLEREGYGVIEGSSSNLFAVQDKTLLTAPLNHLILPGITRAFVLQIAEEAGIAVQEQYFDRSELLASEEVFVTSTGLEVMPVVQIDDESVGAGIPGPVTLELQRRYQQKIGVSIAGR